MKLLAAVVVGGAAAIGLPMLMRSTEGPLGRIAHSFIVHPVPGAAHLPFSVPVFVFVTLFAVLFTSWADR